MINVNQITSQLARLPDQALQQYAQMHKNDPYILSLALSESNRRKQMREGAQAIVPEQPKVVDQAIQSMAAPMPEDIGIAQLPAGEMEFADGGIVAFDEGGPVERYQSGGMMDGFYITPEQMALDELRRQDALRRQNARRAEEEARRAEEARYNALVEGRPVPAAPAVAAASAAPAGNRPAAGAAPAGARPPAGSRPPAGERPPANARPAAPAAAAAPVAARPNLDVGEMTKKALESAATQPNQFAKDIEALGKERVKAKEEEAAGVEAIQKRFDEIFKGRRERLGIREEEVANMKDQGIGLALLQAGAAMMSTPGGIGMALGKGVKVGTEQYALGLDRIRSAQEKLADARDRLDEAEAQRGEMSARELLRVRGEVKNAGISAREDMIKSNMQMYGVNREIAMKMVDNQIKVGVAQFDAQNRRELAEMEIRSRERTAAMLPSELRGAMMLGTGSTDAERLRSGLAALVESKDRMTESKLAELYAKHVADAKKEVPPATPMTPLEFARSIRSAVSAFRPTVADVSNTLPR
jgi:hypothetical protein